MREEILRESMAHALQLPGSECAIEIGVMRGESSEIMCKMALDKPGFMVFGVDPYGQKPFRLGDEVLREGDKFPCWDSKGFGDDYYISAKLRLARFPNHALYLMESRRFLNRMMNHITWWHGGKECPATDESVGLFFHDGDHCDESVIGDLDVIASKLTPGAHVLVDDIDRSPGFVKWMDGQVEYEREFRDKWIGRWVKK